MKSLDYQLNAVQDLKDKADKLLNLEGNHTIVFKAPTGSGKTVMIAEFLKNLVEFRSDSKSFSFIWAAPRKLHSQSREKLEKHYRDSMALKCAGFDDLSDRMISENEILFLNWESIYRKDNIYYRENEQEFYLEKVIENTVDDGRIIVLIIDESHHTAGAENTQGLIRMINAKLTIEVSATPEISGDELVTVYRQKVIEEEMIKKRIAINPGFKNAILRKSPGGGVKVKSSADESTNEFVIRTALEKREGLAKHFHDDGSKINPLMLIQLPDHRHGTLDFKDKIIDILKDNHGITVDNGRLAVYLSENKENLATITQNDSAVEVMIFKQAIALGWDCPRASILVLFRDWRSIVFSIQTVGRILRMPELKHYKNDELNVGYIYTNLGDISIHKDIADGYATIQSSDRKKNYVAIQLQSVHSARQRERTRLGPKFIKFFLEAATKQGLKNRINIDIKQYKQSLITDGVIDPDAEFEHLVGAPTVGREQNEEEIQNKFDQFSIEALSPLYPEERSIKRINSSIYEFFRCEFPMKFQYASVEEQIVVLANGNRQHFLDVINLAKENYLADVEKRAKELAVDETWEVPSYRNYSDEYSVRGTELSIMEPFYENNKASNIEKRFAEFLDGKSEEIEWWFKNGERDGTFFAVPYKEREDNKPFYVDWIVKYKDGRTGLFDTKAGLTAEIAGPKAEGLAGYIKEQNQNGKKLFGGMVIEKNETFWLHAKEKYEYDENDLQGTGWEVFT